MTASDYFDGLYADNVDPWDLSTSPYEQRKLAVLMASLRQPRYRGAFEPGCAVGVTSVALARRCDRLLAMDSARAAVERARKRVEAVTSYVEVVRGHVPADWPDLVFDLVVVSELLYYLGGEDRLLVADRIIHTLAPGGDLVAVHWRRAFDEGATTGDEVHAELADRLGAAGMRVLVDHVEDDFRLQLYRSPTEGSSRGGRATARVQ